MTTDMKALWSALETWATTSNAKKSLRLRAGASEKKIAAAEKKMKLQFPADFRASLLCHDGQNTDDKEAKAYEDEHGGWGGFEWMPGSSPLASLDAIVAQWEDERDEDDDDGDGDGDGDGDDDDDDDDDDGAPEVIEQGTLHNVMVHPKRIPIAGTRFWDGDNTYLDLFPGPKGAMGQLIMFTSECDLAVLGPSFSGAIELYLQALRSGAWIYDAKKGFVRPKNEKADDYPHEGEEFASYVKKLAKTKTTAPKSAAKKSSAKTAKNASATKKPAKKKAPTKKKAAAKKK